MTALSKFPTTSRGVLLFSFNNETMDYSSLALECARRVQTHLGLPVSVVTDVAIEGLDCILVSSPSSSKRNYPEYQQDLSFLNGARVNAYDLSPFDETLVIDTDYLLQSNALNKCFDCLDTWGLKLSKSAFNIDTSELPEDLSTVGPDGLPMYWATVLVFNKSPVARQFFQYWKDVIHNWEVYVTLFRLHSPLLRNDFAVTIALHRMFWSQGIPLEISLGLKLATVPHYWKAFSITDQHLVFTTDGVEVITVPNLDLHVLNKKSLIELLTNRGAE